MQGGNFLLFMRKITFFQEKKEKRNDNIKTLNSFFIYFAAEFEGKTFFLPFLPEQDRKKAL